VGELRVEIRHHALRVLRPHDVLDDDVGARSGERPCNALADAGVGPGPEPLLASIGFPGVIRSALPPSWSQTRPARGYPRCLEPSPRHRGRAGRNGSRGKAPLTAPDLRSILGPLAPSV